MPETLFQRDFSAGWCPSDDAINGRKNALLQMDNVELDKNGALTLIGGTQVIQSSYSALAHTLYSRYINGTRHDYAALADGSVYRDNASIIAGGDSTNAAFGSAYDFVLICSGNQRKKDTGTSLVNLGLNTPSAPSFSGTVHPLVSPGIDISVNTVSVLGSNAVSGGFLVLTPSAGVYSVATPTAGICVFQSFNAPSTPVDFSKNINGNSGTDQDFIQVQTKSAFGINLLGQTFFKLDILLSAGDSGGDQVADYYTFTLDPASLDQGTSIKIRRSDFTRVGTSSATWTTVYGARVTWAVTTSNLAGSTFTFNFADNATSLTLNGGVDCQQGSYQYAIQTINNTGSYLAKSVLSAPSNIIPVDMAQVTLTIPSAAGDPQVTDIWVYSRSAGVANSGLLNQWYRVATFHGNNPGTITVTQGDQITLTVNITFNLNLVSIASSSITDKIFDIIGPIQGRWYYFTTHFVYPSDINNPDLVDSSIAVRTTGSANELFMWARAISASVVIVGTTTEAYLLTGTFVTFPDNSVDVYYQPLGLKYPPITYDAVAYGGAVYYLANDGWRSLLATSFGTTYSSQNNQLLVAPNTDRLYRNEICYEYSPAFLRFAPGTVRMPVTIAKNKLWCFMNGPNRCEVYDFVRQYWRTFQYFLGNAQAVTTTQDNAVLVFYQDQKLREIGILTSKLIDGVTKQTVNLLFPVQDDNKPRQRKDNYTFKSRLALSAGDSLALTITNDSNITTTVGNLTSTTTASEQFLDLSQLANMAITKTWQVNLTGQVRDFTLDDYSIDYDARPAPLSFLKIQPQNWGAPSAKRARTWPIIVDSRGNNITATPSVDGVGSTPVTLNTNFKKTAYYFWNVDAFGTDYGLTLYDPNGLMEVWQIAPPDFVQTLPIPRLYDQVGPSEFLRFGKVIKIELRVFSLTGQTVPFIIFFSDAISFSGSLTFTGGAEDSYFLDIPKGVGGRILRVTVGPSVNPFNRYYMRFLTAPSGGQENTELQWITLPGPELGG